MPGDDKNWVSDDELAALRMERQYLVGLKGTGPDQAMAILREASPAAAMQIVKLAQQADSETVRLRASTYILDKVSDAGEGAKNPWDDIMGDTFKDVESYLAKHGTRPAEED
jgi:hypothetical protein